MKFPPRIGDQSQANGGLVFGKHDSLSAFPAGSIGLLSFFKWQAALTEERGNGFIYSTSDKGAVGQGSRSAKPIDWLGHVFMYDLERHRTYVSYGEDNLSQ